MLETHRGVVRSSISKPKVRMLNMIEQMFHHGRVRQQAYPKNPKTLVLQVPCYSLEQRFTSSTESPSQSKSLQPPAPSASSTTKAPGRGPRTPRRVGTQPTRLEAIGDSLGPLGPLGDPSFSASSQQEEPPAPPQKEQSLPVRDVRHTPSTSQSSLSKSMMDSVDLGDDETERPGTRSRIPPPVQPRPSGPENTRRQTQPSVSIEQAAKPTFDITVGDPHKVGDLTSSHIVYQVRTKVMELVMTRR